MSRVVALPPVVRVPLAQADDALVVRCVQVAADDPVVFTAEYRSAYATSLLAERAAVLAGRSPAVRDLLTTPDGEPVGWMGWARYKGPIEAWESTTFFAPPLRGTGMLEVARCWQVHLASALRSWERSDDVVLLSSIAQTNVRSLVASDRYAAQHTWERTWLTVTEPAKGRTSRVLLWPRRIDIPHSCYVA